LSSDSKFILLGEDDLDDQELLKEIFSGIDDALPLVFVNNGNQMLNFLKEQTKDRLPSLIVIDYNMPGMNGAEILRELKAINRYNDIPRIIWSTSRSETFRNSCLALGATDYMIKPSTVSELTDIAHQMLSFCKP
jgi:CheY-like chemotaxis protein